MEKDAAANAGAWATLKRTASEFREDNLTDWAAALTYYGLLSLFPALIAMVSLLGLFGDPRTTTSSLTEIITSIGPESAAQTFEGPIRSVASNQSAAGFAFVFGLVLALWSASGYIGAFIRASNVIYETTEGRPFWKLRPLQLAVTLTMVVAMALLALGLVLTGPIVEAVADPVGLGDTAVDVWSIAKWPAMVAVFVLMVDLLYYASPNAKLRGFRWVTPGCLVAMVVLGHRVGRLRRLRRQLRFLRQDLRHARRPGRAAGLALDQQPGDPLRPPAQRRARAQRRDRGGRAAGRAGDPARAALGAGARSDSAHVAAGYWLAVSVAAV